MSFLRFMLVSLILLSTTLWAGVGKVALLKGEATLERGVQKLALQNGTALEEKDIIKTSKDAQVQLMFEDKTVITLGSESEFKIEEYLNDTANPKAKFKFNQGAFKTITGQIGKTAPDNFKLETKTATIGIRGTIVAGNVPPPPPPSMPPMPEAIFCLGGTITVAPITMPTIIVIVPTGSFTQMLTPSTPPSPPVIFTPADLQQLNQNLGGTPPPPPPGGNTPPQGGNTPPTANPDGGNDSPPPAPAPSRAPTPAPSQAPVPQTFTPTAAASALQTNSQTLSQNLVIQNVAQELNVSSDTIQDQIQNQICPSGTTGTFPNCVAMTCPENTTGVYPNCTALTCPAGTTGTYPNCVAQTCPSGTTGTFPNCVAMTCPENTTGVYPNCTALTCPAGTTGTYPNCVAQTCPSGTTGTFPNCVAMTCPENTTGVYPNCTALTCPAGTTGTYPNCVAQTCPSGTTGTFPNCVAMTCPENTTGVYPNCTALTCPAGTTGTYPNCVAQTCPSGTTGTFPNCVAMTCPENTTGVYPNCTALTCPAGTTGTYPNCTTIPSGGGTPSTVTTTLTVMGARESMNGTYMYLEPTTITLTGSSSTSLSGSIVAPIFSDSNATQISNETITVSGANENLRTQWFPSNDQLLIYGTPITSLPTDGIVGFTETEDFGNAKMVANFKNKRALIVDFDNEDNGLFLFFGTLGNTASLGGSIYSYGVGFSDHAEGNATGLFFGHSIPSYVGLIGVDFNGSHYSAGAYAGFQTDYKATANATGTLALTGLTTSRYLDGSETIQMIDDEISIDIARATGSATGTITLLDRTNYALTQSDANKSSYIHDNYFAITGFDAQESWLVALPTDMNFTTADSTLSWGMWAVNETNSSKLLPYYNYWVAGSTLTPGSYLTLRETSYTYNGKTLGVVSNNGTATPITPSNSSVRFVFDFGNQTPLNAAESYIRFGSWDLAPFNSVVGAGSDNYFAGDLEGVDRNGSFYGYFYGSSAESIGGAFKASDSNLGDAQGVFVGAQTTATTPTFTYPTTLDANLSITSSISSPIALKGSATSTYTYDSINWYRGDNPLDLNISTNISVLGNINLWYASGGNIPIVQTSDNNLTYTSNSLAIKDFDTYSSYFLKENSLASWFDYLSWGYWASSGYSATKLYPEEHYWIAGETQYHTAASNYLSTLNAQSNKTILRYEGPVYGHTIVNGTRAMIAENEGGIKIDLDLGATTENVLSSSNLYLESNGATWQLFFHNASTFDSSAGSLSGMAHGPIKVNGSDVGYMSANYGAYFYGANAEELGGTIAGASDAYILEGVFLTQNTINAPSLPSTLYGLPVIDTVWVETDSNASMANDSLSGMVTSWSIENNQSVPKIDKTIDISLMVESNMTTVSIFDGGDTLMNNKSFSGENNMTTTSINDFIGVSWDGKTVLYTEPSNPNDYVSWGYWGTKEVDITQVLASKNYWVAGKDAVTAATYIASLIASGTTTPYMYDGKVLGHVLDGSNVSHTIDTANSSVNLDFDFGGGTGSLKNTSRINFSANSQGWELIPTANVTGGTFTGPIGGSGITGTIKGQFFGSSAQAVGGTFNAATATEKAIGVFKAVR